MTKIEMTQLNFRLSKEESERIDTLAREAKLTKSDFIRRKVFNDSILASTEDELTKLKVSVEKVAAAVDAVSSDHGTLFMAVLGVGIVEIITFLILLYKMPAVV